MRTTNRIALSSLLITAILVLIAGPTVFAAEKSDKEKLEDMVVTATRTEVSLEETTKSIEVVTAADRDEQQQYYLPELIDNQPGIFMTRNGGLGQYTSISIRGAGTQHTQYQYNGFPLRDAADGQSTLKFFIEDMYGGSNLDRIEILKGNNSVLYGSQAMGGVINIIPKKWQEGLTGELRSEVGPEDTFIGNARIAYGQENYYVDVNPLYATTDGETYGGDNGYYYDNTGLTFSSGYKPSADTALEFSVIAYDAELALTGQMPALDASGNLIKNQADPVRHRESQLYQLGLNWDHNVSQLWDYSIKGSYGETERHYFWSATAGDQSNYDGERSYLEMQHNLHFSDQVTLTIGGDFEKSVYDGQEPTDPSIGDYTPFNYDEEWDSYDLFSQAQFAVMDRSLFFTLGARYNNHEVFDAKTVWEVSGAYLLKSSDTKFHVHVGTGYRTPSLYEIYGGYLYGGTLYTIGNPNLIPEESIGYEAGIDQSFADGLIKVGATYFSTTFDDLIIFDSGMFAYNNASEAKLSGVEACFSLRPWNKLKIDLAYTYSESEYKENSSSEWVRKEYLPENKVDLDVTAYPTDKLTIVCDISWQDEKIVPLRDPSYNEVRWEEDAVTTVNLAVSYHLLNHIDLFARIENLTDEDYTESGYCMPGSSLYAGARFYF
jgi:vitamin B12 transporter